MDWKVRLKLTTLEVPRCCRSAVEEAWLRLQVEIIDEESGKPKSFNVRIRLAAQVDIQALLDFCE